MPGNPRRRQHTTHHHRGAVVRPGPAQGQRSRVDNEIPARDVIALLIRIVAASVGTCVGPGGRGPKDPAVRSTDTGPALRTAVVGDRRIAERQRRQETEEQRIRIALINAPHIPAGAGGGDAPARETRGALHLRIRQWTAACGA